MQVLQFIRGLETNVSLEETSPSHVSGKLKMFNGRKVKQMASKRTTKNCPNMMMKIQMTIILKRMITREVEIMKNMVMKIKMMMSKKPLL